MGTRYAATTATSFNSAPPPDDASTGSNNRVDWSKIKTKLADPVKTRTDTMDTQILTALDESARAITADDTAIASDHLKTIEVRTSSVAVTLSDATTMAAGYRVNVFNASSGIITVKRATSTDSIAGMQRDIQIPSGHGRMFKVNAAATGYLMDGIAPHYSICQGRLTAQAGTAVPTADIASTGLIQWTPYGGDLIGLYTGSQWVVVPFVETTCVVPAVSGVCFDIWASLATAGGIVVDTTAWTSETARATAIVLQNGVYVKSGDPGRRYLGTGYALTPSTITDSVAKRWLWNYYNRVSRPMKVTEGTSSWTYSAAAFRQARGTATNQLDIVIGVSEDLVHANTMVSCVNDTADSNALSGIGVDSATANSSTLCVGTRPIAPAVPGMLRGEYAGYPGIGRHRLVWIESAGDAVGTTTWYGASHGTTGIAAIVRG